MRRLLGALVRRLGILIVTVLAAALLSAVLVRLSPGFGTDERQLDLRRSEESIRSIHAAASSPIAGFEQYLVGLIRGDWGESISLGRPVRELVVERGPLTAATLASGISAAWLLALAVSLALEAIHRPELEMVGTFASGVFLCLPAAVVALGFLYLERGPALALGVVLAPRLFRDVRNVLRASARSPHVLAARARGIGPTALLWRHTCVPAAGELLALAGISVSMAVSLIIPVEALCDSPGLGQLVWQAATARDLSLLVHLTVLVAVAACAGNLVADASRAVLDRGVR